MLLRKMQRVILGLKNNSEYRVPKFPECILDFFTSESNCVSVSYTLTDDLMVLTPNKNGFKLQHSPECPIKILSSQDYRGDDIIPEKKALNIVVAVSVVIESSDQHILLTKRATHMRSSPRVWVPPGGHLEPGESLLQGGIREVMEETGLNIKDGEASILCLWENVYPIMLGFGIPTSHVLVVYFHVKMNKSHRELQNYIKLDPEEVQSCCWLSACTVSQLFNSSTVPMQKQYSLERGVIVEEELDPNTMFNRLLWTKPDPYTGSQYALRNWIERKLTKDFCISKF